MLIASNGYSVLSKFVSDGDTLKLDFRGEVFSSRLRWIDTPETRKPSIHTNTDPMIQAHWNWAQKAKTALMNLVYQKPLVCILIEKDGFNRWICDLYLGKVSATTNVQIALCKAGMAVSYLPYNRYSYTSRELAVIRGIITQTANANRKKIGIWSEPNFILPHEFKKLNLS